MKKLIMFLMIVFVLSSVSYGALTDDLLSFWAFDGDAKDNHTGLVNGTATGNAVITGTANCKLGNCYAFDGAEDSISFGNNYDLADISTGEISVFAWVNTNTITGEHRIIGKSLTGGDENSWALVIAGDELRLFIDTGATAYAYNQTSVNLGINQWYMVGFTWKEGERPYLYVHNESRDISTGGGDMKIQSWSGQSNTANLRVGLHSDNVNHDWDGEIDEVGIWDRVLTQNEINVLYNESYGKYYPFSTPNPAKFEVTAKSFWDNNSISNFSAIINGTYFNTTNETIVTDFIADSNYIFNIIVSSDDRFNVSYTHNISSDLIAYLKQSQINLSIHKEFQNLNISNYNITIDGQTFVVLGESYLIYPDTDNYTVTSVVDNNGVETYSLIDDSLEVLALDNKSAVFSVAGHTINILAKNILTGANINNFTVELVGLNFTDNRSNITTNGVSTFKVNDQSFNITIDAGNFALVNNSIILDVDNSKEEWNYTFNLYVTNSVNITIYDSDTGLLIDDRNITISFIGASTLVDNTSNGTYYVDLLNPSDYTITASATGYRQTSYLFTLNNRTYNAINLYLQNSSNSQLVLVTVKDKFSGQYIQNAYVTVQRWSNGWFTDQILQTDFQGRSEGHFVLSTVYYNFIVSVDGVNYFGVINSDDNKKLIYAEDVNNGIIIEIDQNPNNAIPNYQNSYGVNPSLTYTNLSNTTGRFRFSYNADDNLGRNGVLYVYKNGVLDCTSSSSSESAILFCNVNHTGDRVLFVGRAYIDDVLVGVATGTIGQDESYFNWGAIGYLFLFFILIIAGNMFIELPSLSNFILMGVFSFGILGEIVFPTINFGLISLIIGVGYVIFRIPTKQGVNN